MSSSSQPPSPPSGLTRFGLIALALGCLGLGAIALYLGTQLTALRHDLSQRLAQTDQLSHQVLQLAQQSNETNRESSTRLALLEARFSQSQNQQIELEALYQDLMRNHDEWILAEVEQLVIIANQQLELTGNVPSALAALEAADLRLQRIDKPLFSQLRNTLKQDMDRLKALPYVDTNSIALNLDALVHDVDTLPLASENRPSAASPNQRITNSGIWGVLSQKILAELDNSIKIRRMDNPELPLLTPQQSYFLRANLKLQLMAARIDALARQESRYQGDLALASEWLTRYFDPSAPALISVRTRLNQLVATPVSIPIPDVNATLEAVHNARRINP